MPPRFPVVVLALALSAAGCLPHELDWEIGWSEDGLSERLWTLEASITEGGCAGGTVVWSGTTGRTGHFDSPPELGEGHFGFGARAGDEQCSWYAQGCVDRKLPAGDNQDDIVVVLSPLEPPSAACPADECLAGSCGAGCVAGDCSCPAGRCTQRCTEGGDCSCLAGNCTVRCEAGAACSCVGGGCTMDCAAGSECSCVGGSCVMACQEGATCSCLGGHCE